MTLIRRFNNQYPDISNVFDDFFGGSAFPTVQGTKRVPSINVKETEDEYNIEVAAPGLKKDNFKVEVHNNVLTLSYEDEESQEQEEKGYTRREFSYTGFRRSFSIPRNEVDDSKIDASYKDGILMVTLHKREEVKPKPARMISIK
ncbi:MAG TPA: Hsp20/alpha crystallin family protein [Marinilabiliaceae bacterium]|nr:Hsp20/alpha crystallin family protein [Marinilabiliaceae bacterium]